LTKVSRIWRTSAGRCDETITGYNRDYGAACANQGFYGGRILLPLHKKQHAFWLIEEHEERLYFDQHSKIENFF
jgi:hypothetical protein